MSDIERQLGYSNIADVVLKIIRKSSGKRAKDLPEEVKQKHKAFFAGEAGIFIIEKLTGDIIEHCQLTGAIEFRKKSGYNHDDIMVGEETSVTEEIINLSFFFVPNNKSNKRKPDIWFKIQNFAIEIDEGNHENYDSVDEKEKKEMLKKHNFKIFQCNPNDSNFDPFKFVGKINLYVWKICKKSNEWGDW